MFILLCSSKMVNSFEKYKTVHDENYVELINNFIEEKKWQWNVKL